MMLPYEAVQFHYERECYYAQQEAMTDAVCEGPNVAVVCNRLRERAKEHEDWLKYYEENWPEETQRAIDDLQAEWESAA